MIRPESTAVRHKTRRGRVGTSRRWKIRQHLKMKNPCTDALNIMVKMGIAINNYSAFSCCYEHLLVQLLLTDGRGGLVFTASESWITCTIVCTSATRLTHNTYTLNHLLFSRRELRKFASIGTKAPGKTNMKQGIRNNVAAHLAWCIGP
jgi:hypothetical protein